MKTDVPMVRVEWVDASMSAEPHWQDGDRPAKPRRGANKCQTVGFLTHVDEHWAQVVSTLTSGQHAHVTEIPASMIKSVQILVPALE
jgi:hypothetical protein